MPGGVEAGHRDVVGEAVERRRGGKPDELGGGDGRACADGGDELSERHDVRVVHVERDLRPPAPGEREPEGPHAAQAAARLSDLGRNPPRDAACLRAQGSRRAGFP